MTTNFYHERILTMTSRTIQTRPCGGWLCWTFVCLFACVALNGCINRAGNDVNYSDQASIDRAWDQGADRAPEARTLFALAKLLISQGRDDQAQSILSRIIRERPDFLEAYVEQAEVHLRHRRVHAAQKVLAEGLLVAPHDPVLLNDIGMCWLLRRDYQRALDQFTKAAATAPDNAKFRANMALALGLSGRYEECLAAYEQVLRPADAHYNLAVACESRNDSERAALEFARARELDRPAVTLVEPDDAGQPDPDGRFDHLDQPESDEAADQADQSELADSAE